MASAFGLGTFASLQYILHSMYIFELMPENEKYNLRTRSGSYPLSVRKLSWKHIDFFLWYPEYLTSFAHPIKVGIVLCFSFCL